jgi:acetyl-CoA carboxylase biotin carboxyl carrier protein
VVDIEKIRELVSMMAEHELTEIELRDGEQTILIKRGGGQVTIAPVAAAPVVAPVPVAAPGSAAAANGAADYEAQGLVAIKSPMVGTFYSSPDPDSAPFVGVGGQVTNGTVVCIIEAMKVFNEIKSEVSGTVEQVLVSNEQAVEYGQPLFLVRPRA